MSYENEINQLVTETNAFITEVNSKTPVLDSALTSANTSAVAAANSAAAAALSANTAVVQSDIARGFAVSTEAVLSLAQLQREAIQNSERQVSLASGLLANTTFSTQDLTGVNAAALHRSPNAITSIFVYDTSKDSDGGAWTEKCQHTSWYNETLSGNWLGAQPSELFARNERASLGPNQVANPTFATDVSGFTFSLGGSLEWVSPGLAKFTSTLGTQYATVLASFANTAALELNVLYEISVDVIPGTYTGSVVLNTDTANATGGIINQPATVTQTLKTYHIPTLTNQVMRVRFESTHTAGQFIYLSNFRYRKVTALNTISNDYYQSTVDGRFYRLWKNLISRSSTFAGFGNSGTVASLILASGQGPSGGTAYKLVPNASASTTGHIGTTWFGVASAGTRYSFSIRAKAGEYPRIGVRGMYTPATGCMFHGTIDLTNGTSVTNTGLYPVTATPDPRGNGYYIIKVEGIIANGGANLDATIEAHNATSVAQQEFVADGTSGIFVTEPQYESGTIATAYEENTNTTTITEVFRGNKRDFPRLAGIVAEANSVNIYDLTEPGRPMWMRFLASGSTNTTSSRAVLGPNNLSTVTALNGILATGCTTNSGYQGSLINFFTESVPYLVNGANGTFRGNIAQRNETLGFSFVGGFGNIVGTSINAIAMTVLPDAPIDPVTGLRVPTIAVATSGGVSVIKHNGVVVNSAVTSSFTSVAITPRLLLATYASQLAYVQNPNQLSASFVFNTQGAGVPGTINFNGGVGQQLVLPTRENIIHRGQQQINFGAAVLAKFNESTPARNLVARATNTFNTGWMAGDTRRCYLSDNASGTVTAPQLLANPSFDTDLSSWTVNQSTSWVSGAMRMRSDGNPDPNSFSEILTVKPGAVYEIEMTMFGSDTVNRTGYIRLSTTGTPGGAIDPYAGGSGQTISPGVTATFKTRTLIPAGVTSVRMSVSLSIGAGAAGAQYDLLNVTVREVVADRSYRGGAANITGTITRAQLASNTSLVGYSGFSAANYLREPYSTDLDFGIGEFNASAWINTTYAAPGNLTTNSNTFSSWNSTPGFTRQADLITAPDNNQYAIKFLCTSTAVEDGGIIKRDGANLPNTSVSFYVQDIGIGKRLYFYDNSGGAGFAFSSYFNFSTKTFSNSGPVVTSYEELPNNWYRLMYHLSLGNANYLKIKYENLAVGDALHLFGHQIERTSTPSTYKPSGASQVIITSPFCSRAHSSGPTITLGINSEARLTATAFDGTTTRTVTTSAAYNTATWIKAGVNYTTDGSLAITVNGREVAVTRGNPLLTLSSRYNLLTFSEQLDNAAWTKLTAGDVVSVNAGIAPDGTTTAENYVPNTTNTGGHIIRQGWTAVIGQVNVMSIYAKANGYNWLFLSNNYTIPDRVWFNLQAGTVGTVSGGTTGATITSVGNGWYRCSFTTAASTGVAPQFQVSTATGDNVTTFAGDGTSGILVWGAQVETGSTVKTYQRVAAATDFDFQAPLTIGNNFSLDVPFPGSIALLKLGATVPTLEQDIFMYEQEKQLFRSNTQSVLPDSTIIVDMAYDDATDRWVSISASNESYWTGLVRNSVTPVPAGSYSKVFTTSGIELSARATTNPGVDVTIPTYLLREDLNKRAEAASRNFKELVTIDYIGGFTASTTNGSTAITSVANLTYPTSYIGARISGSGIPTNTTITAVSGTTIYISAPATATATGVSISFLDFRVPTGLETEVVTSAGSIRREGATSDFTRLFDGFVETIRFATAPGATAWVQIQATRVTT